MQTLNPLSLPTESNTRARLGIPADARQVLIFAESSHWDPNWLRTSQEYFQGMVRPGLMQAVSELRADPRRIYSIECMFYLRLFWEAHPELHAELVDLLNAGRLRLTGTGVTTSDTLIPSDEAILRDLLIGQDWLRSIGVTQQPRVAYFPDCFGHSPNLPALLNAAGFDRSAVTRIDGMWFMSADLDLPSNFPLKGSSAERLLKQEQSLDFIWRARDGSQILCHWNAFTYGQGDLLADAGAMRIYLYPRFSKPDRSEKIVNRRVGEFMRQLLPLSRTPYMFCPIGWDFNPPIPALRELLERYNRNVYPTSGTWLANASLDDYFDLLESHRQNLPVLDLDPNPYWTGFYTSRPGLKQRAFRLWERLELCEKFGLLAEQAGCEKNPVGNLKDSLDTAWWSAAVSNHHDLITGTSPDPVAYEEQIPMLDAALETSGKVMDSLLDELSSIEGGANLPLREPAIPAGSLPEYTASDQGLEITTPHLRLALSAAGGGTLQAWQSDGRVLLKESSHQVGQYFESGGLWRMGYEYRGGRFQPARLLLPPAHFHVSPQGQYLRVTWESRPAAFSLSHSLWISRDDPLIYIQVEGLAPQKSTLVLGFRLPFTPEELHMEAPGGTVTRPLTRVYGRTFWPVQHWLHAPIPGHHAGFALLLRHMGAVSVNTDGLVEVITHRNAIREKAYLDLFNLLGMPATGIERERTTFQAALAFPEPADASHLPALARQLLTAPWASDEDRLSAWATNRLVQVESDQVFVTAVKPAWQGSGIILRLSSPNAPLPPVRLRLGFPARQACVCDTLERDLSPLTMEGQSILLPVERSIITLRIT